MRAERRITVVGLLALAIVVLLFGVRPAPLERLELALLDWRFALRGVEAPRAPVSVVAIDARSIDELGRWPWPRSVIAQLLDRLERAEVAAIGLDIVFSEASTPLEDEALEEALARSRHSVLSFFFRTGLEEAVQPEAWVLEDLALVSKAEVLAKLPSQARIPLMQCEDVEPNLARLARAARGMGFFSAWKDPDGVVRKAPLVAACGDLLYGSLALVMLEILAGERAVAVGDDRGMREVRVGERVLATDEGGRILINFRGPARTFPVYPAVAVLRGEVGRAELGGHAVVVGPTEPGIMDIHPTPFDPAFPGVEVHANILDNALAGDAMRRSDTLVALELALVLLLGAALTFAAPRLGRFALGAALAGFLLAAVVGGAVYLFVGHGVWLNLSYPGLTVVAVYLAVGVTQGVTVERHNRAIRKDFKSYVAPDVVEEMLRHPEAFRLGGERRRLSILFSDVVGFTPLSEELGPEDTTRLLNAYLTPMTREIHATRGTLDKYIGDAIVAFWGAPLPVEAHPQRACETALAMIDELQLLKRSAHLPGIERLDIGIGIHTAEVAVGKMGSEFRFAYTMIGDGVNLCSRLEGLNRSYGTRLLASFELVRELPPKFRVRELDTVRVKGRQEPVRIFEVLGRGAPDEDEERAYEHYSRGLRAYRAGRWSEARAEFAAARAARARDDAPARALIERIESLEKDPPQVWDGVWNFETK